MAEEDFFAKDAFLESIHKAKFRPVPDDFKALDNMRSAAYFNRNRPMHSYSATLQEPGTRPSCALPYCMAVDGRLSADKTRFGIVFGNDDKPFGERTAGAPVNVYAPGLYALIDQPDKMEPLRTWAYAREARATA